MKPISYSGRTITTLAVSCLLATPLYGKKDKGNNGNVIDALIPATPLGFLSAYPTIVQTGAKPTLTWNIMYPTRVDDVGVVDPPGTIILEKDTYVEVKPVGTGPTDFTTEESPSQRYAEARMSIDGSSYTQLFYGTSSEVTPQYALYTKKLKRGTKINFGGRYVKNNNWTPFYTTNSSNMQVVTLKDGDTIPTSFDLHTSPELAGYLAPYLNEDGTVDLGPMNLLVMMELGSTTNNQPCFDYQDVVLLVTFAAKHPNNGHGNNLDGVDSSNPGKGKGGPTGANNSGQDPSGGVDDEAKKDTGVLDTIINISF